jgi:phage tail sheath gpL-like
MEGKRQRVVCASTASLATASTLGSTTVNHAQVQIGWHYLCEQTPAILAATLAGTIALGLALDRARNFDGTVLNGIIPQPVIADRPIASEITSALNNGLTPFGILASGQVTLVRSITSRAKDAAGNADFTLLDTTKVDVPFYIADDLVAAFSTEFANFKLTVDNSDPEIPPPPGVATPKVVRDWIAGRLSLYERQVLIENVDAKMLNLVVEIDDLVAGRINAAIPCDVVEGLHQAAIDVRQIG